MSTELYETLALGMRYWFLFLMILIAWRSYRWFARDRRQRKKRLRLLPDAGLVGEWVVLTCESDAFRPGDELPVPVEGVLGSIRSCDICLPVAGVHKRHLWFSFDEGRGLRVEPMVGCRVLVNGEQAATRRHPLYLAHGARLTVGECELRLRMFAGFEYAGRHNAAATGAPRSVEPEAPQEQPQAAPPTDVAAMQRQQLLWQQQLWMNQQAMALRQQAMQQQMMQQQAAAQAAQARRPAVVTDAAYRPPQGEEDETAYGEAEYDETEYAEDESEFDEAEYSGDEALDDDAEYADDEALGDGAGLDDAQAADRADADEYAMNSGESTEFAAQTAPGGLAARPPVTARHGRQSWLPPLEEDAAALGDTQEWPALPYPQREEVRFRNTGYTYPDYVEPDKSLYVEPSDSDRADELVWDKLLKRRRDE